MSKNLELQTQWIFRDKYNSKWNKNILNDISRLKEGEPVDYIIAWKPFLNCKIDLSFNPLIPRPETEYWVEKFIHENKKQRGVLKIADVFSGSGCIGIAILKNIKNSKVDFFEIDPNLIKQIKLNLKINKINKSRYRVIQTDIFSDSVNTISGGYDFILANPPYIALSRKSKVQKAVLKYEPKKALFSGKDGLDVIRKFLKQSKVQLKNNGEIWMEFDSFQKPLIEKLLRQFKYKSWEFYKDQYKKWRFVKIFA